MNHRKRFFKGFSIIFPCYANCALLLQSCLNKAGIQFKHNNVLSNEDEEYQDLKGFQPTSEYTVKSHPYLSNE